jgi:phosphoglucosamine mutase
VETKVGDRYVLEEMLRTGAVLGGEQSGHIIFLRHATTGDGLLTAVQLFSLARRRDVPLATLGVSMPRYPQVLENIEVVDRNGLEEAAPVWEAVAQAEQSLGENGRVLVRPSGTEPLVRVMVEATTEEAARSHAEAIARAVRVALNPA